MPPTGGHGDGHKNTGNDRADQKPAQGDLLPRKIPDQNRNHHRQQRRDDHLFQCELGDDVHAGTIIGFCRAFHNTRNFTELASHFVHHCAAGVPHRLHGNGGEQVGQQAADEQADDDVYIRQIELDGFLSAMQCKLLYISGKQHQCGKSGGTDGIALGHGLGGVAHRIQGIGDGPDALVHLGHFRDTAGIVGDGAVSINGDDHTGHRQHGHGRHGNTVKTAQVISHEDMAKTDGENRCRGGLHANRQAGDDVGTVPCSGGFGYAFYRRIDAGIILGDDNDQNRQYQAHQRTPIDVHGGNDQPLQQW